MASITRVGIVGPPHSGKTHLVAYLRDLLKDDYNVILVEDVSIRLHKLGLNPPFNMSEIAFQIECLKNYADLYKDADKYIKKYQKDTEKDIVILYDTVPAMGQCFLNSSEDLHEWVERFTKEDFGPYKVDILFVAELLSGEYLPDNKEAEGYIDVDEILAISDRVDYVFQSGIRLPRDLTVDERVSLMAEEIYKYIKHE